VRERSNNKQIPLIIPPEAIEALTGLAKQRGEPTLQPILRRAVALVLEENYLTVPPSLRRLLSKHTLR
jgi:hypothetical protein